MEWVAAACKWQSTEEGCRTLGVSLQMKAYHMPLAHNYNAMMFEHAVSHQPGGTQQDNRLIKTLDLALCASSLAPT